MTATDRSYGTSLTGYILHTMTGPETAEALCGTTLHSLDVEPIQGDRYCKRCQKQQNNPTGNDGEDPRTSTAGPATNTPATEEDDGHDFTLLYNRTTVHMRGASTRTGPGPFSACPTVHRDAAEMESGRISPDTTPGDALDMLEYFAHSTNRTACATCSHALRAMTATNHGSPDPQEITGDDVEKTLTDAGHESWNTGWKQGTGAMVEPSSNGRDVTVIAYYWAFFAEETEQRIQAYARTLTEAGYHVQNNTYYLTVRPTPPEPDAAAAAEKVLTDYGHTELDFIAQKAGAEHGFRVDPHPTDPDAVHVHAYHEGSYASLKTRAHIDLYAAALKNAGWTIDPDKNSHTVRDHYRLTARRPKGRPLYVVVGRHIDGQQEIELPTDNLEHARLKAQTITETPKWGASIEVRYPDGSIGRTA